ncbi:MAG: hypothetical protein RIS22_667 [Actinomycetota bacterium]|jgi:competence protein ComEA
MPPLDPQIIERIAERPRKYRIPLPSPGLLANAQVSLSSIQKRALIFLGIVALALSVLLLLSAQARPAADVIAAAPQSNSEPSSTTALLVIDVQGEVVNPGLYEIPFGSRVGDAIKAAGGVRKGVSTSSVNLARFLEDGEQLFVAGVDQNFSPTGGAIPSSTGGGKLNLNRASESELDGLPGVGPVLAKRIIAYRNENGNFSSVDELRKVSGIGPAKFGELQSFVTV